MALGIAILVWTAVAPAPAARAAGELHLSLNGKPVTLKGLALKGDVAVVPAKEFLELLGEQVFVVPGGRALRAFGRDQVLTLLDGQATLGLSEDQVDLPFAPWVDDDARLIAPLRPLAEALGVKVDWQADTFTITLEDAQAPQPAPEPERKPRVPFTQDDLTLLARIIYAEAPDEPFEGQVAVGAVVLNRVLSGRFPHSIHDVIFAPGQFAGIRSPLFERDPSPSALKAAEEALYGSDPSHGALFFYDPRSATDPWIRSLPVLATIGHHRFATTRDLAP
ncbi:MAG: cell wall hydrolase [Clostridia bacterium]|nr:cell wall hydrolase [Clostridia bacterium]